MSSNHQDRHPYLLGYVSIWRVTGQDEDDDSVTLYVGAFTAVEAALFCTDEYRVRVNGVVEMGNLDITGDVLSKAVVAHNKVVQKGPA